MSSTRAGSARSPAMAGFVDTRGRNPFARRGTPSSPRTAIRTTPYISRTWRWSPFDEEDQPPTPWRAPQQPMRVEDMAASGCQAVDATAMEEVEKIDDSGEAVNVEYGARPPSAHSETASSPRTPESSGSSARYVALWETPDTPDSTNSSSPCPVPKVIPKEAVAIPGSVLEKCSDLLAAVTLPPSPISSQHQVHHVQPTDLDDTPTCSFDPGLPQASPQSRHHSPTPIPPRRGKRKANSPLLEELTASSETRPVKKPRLTVSSSTPTKAPPVKKQRLTGPTSTSIKVRPFKKQKATVPSFPSTKDRPRPRRTEVELLLDAARRFGYKDLPDLRGVVAGRRVDERPGPTTRSAARRVGRETQCGIGKEDVVMAWARAWSAAVRERRVVRIWGLKRSQRGAWLGGTIVRWRGS